MGFDAGFTRQQTEQETTTELAPRTADETAIVRLLRRVAEESGAQLGDLGALASGDVSALSATPQDRALAEEASRASAEIARRRLMEQTEDLMRQIQGAGTARGIEGSSLEAAQTLLAERDIVNRLADIGSREQAMTAENLQRLPFQRAQTQMSANQLLFQRLTGSALPVAEMGLQERLAGATRRSTGTTSGANIGFSSSPQP